MPALGTWIEGQYRHAAQAMLRSVSPIGVVKHRPGFGQSVRPLKGAIVASPVLAAYDPDPDYFFHWYRDSAVVIDAMRLLHEDGTVGEEALAHLADFVRFSSALQRLDGRELVAHPGWRGAVAPEFRHFLRSDAELAGVHGAAVATDTRVNPDATIDISGWARPQHDGPALRALALMRWWRRLGAEGAAGLGAPLAGLITSDLRLIAGHWREPSFDIWEEERGVHYYTRSVAAAALASGAAWSEAVGADAAARECRAEARTAAGSLEEFWSPEEGCYRSRLPGAGVSAAKALDISVILAALHAAGEGPHPAHVPRLQATLARLEALFDAAYPINHGRGSGRGPAMGRYAGDAYYSGGAYYFSTLGAAEFCYRAAAGRLDSSSWIDRGEAFLETVRAYTPPDGAMSEQFDQRSGAQSSARELAWSYASFISCICARRDALGAGLRGRTS